MNNTCRRFGRRTTAIAALFVVLPALAAEPPTGTLSVFFENDTFSINDQHYTNGLQVAWTPDGGAPPAWALRVSRLLPWFPAEGEVRHAYAFGQNMYTSTDISLVDPPPGEPPYAGWLYGAIGMRVGTARQFDRFTMTLGVVGPASLAEQGQKLMHKLTGSDRPRGWDTQLENEPGVVLAYLRGWRRPAMSTAGGFMLDLTPHAGGALGNVYTYANAGLTLRYGRSLPLDDGQPRIQPGVPGSGMFASARGSGWYVFAGFDGRAVARNIFLDGNTFRDSRSVDKEHFVTDVQVGIALMWRTARLGYAHVLRTREYEGQPRNEDFGVLSLSVPL